MIRRRIPRYVKRPFAVIGATLALVALVGTTSGLAASAQVIKSPAHPLAKSPGSPTHRSRQSTKRPEVTRPKIFHPIPFGPALRHYLATRQSFLALSLYNQHTKTTITWHPGPEFDTASIVKVTIMATLLWQAQQHHQPLTPSEKSLMVPMIEKSSNSAATALWSDAGQAPGIASFLQAAHMDDTIPGQDGYWGLTQTSSADQAHLLSLLRYPNNLLDPTSRAYALNLMEHVVGYEDWGVSSGPPRSSWIALKNGWLPIPGGWEINSVGSVVGSGRSYTLAILSRNNPSEAYGIQTVDTVSRIVFQSLKPELLSPQS